MRKMEKHVPLLILLASAIVTALVMLIYIYDTNRIHKKDISAFSVDTTGYAYDIEVVEKGGFFCYIEGYGYHTEDKHHFYNFGFDMEGEGIYLDLGIGLVSGDKVYVLPTVQVQRQDIFEQAENLQDTFWYNFYAGVQTKFISRLVPVGQYSIAVIYTDTEGNSSLLMTEKVVEI